MHVILCEFRKVNLQEIGGWEKLILWKSDHFGIFLEASTECGVSLYCACRYASLNFHVFHAAIALFSDFSYFSMLMVRIVSSIKAMIIIAWNGTGQPSAVFDANVFKKVLSIFITAAIMKLGQGK